jgi:hypothetical protein
LAVSCIGRDSGGKEKKGNQTHIGPANYILHTSCLNNEWRCVHTPPRPESRPCLHRARGAPAPLYSMTCQSPAHIRITSTGADTGNTRIRKVQQTLLLLTTYLDVHVYDDPMRESINRFSGQRISSTAHAEVVWKPATPAKLLPLGTKLLVGKAVNAFSNNCTPHVGRNIVSQAAYKPLVRLVRLFACVICDGFSVLHRIG